MGTRQDFFKIYWQFGHAPSRDSPALGQDVVTNILEKKFPPVFTVYDGTSRLLRYPYAKRRINSDNKFPLTVAGKRKHGSKNTCNKTVWSQDSKDQSSQTWCTQFKTQIKRMSCPEDCAPLCKQ